jgi:glycerol-3-phosphate dehydrogenase
MWLVGNREFSIRSRPAELAEASAGELDVLVVGLGATGAGVALDAASRGLTVAAIDMGDLASGTSSKSSKLIHGGLRYLEHHEFALVHEGVAERQLLLRLAPHLVRPMDFVYPVWPDTARRRLLGLGLTTYDVLAGLRNVRRHDRIGAEEAIALAPALARAGAAYAYVYGDCVTDDARLVLEIVRQARRFGALTVTYAEAVGLCTVAGAVRGARVRDRLTGAEYEIRARHVVNATGVWVDRLLAMADSAASPAVTPSKGVHVVVPAAKICLNDASVLLPSSHGDRRSMFAIAWDRQTILGTTDTAYAGALEDLTLTAEDLDYVLSAANTVFDADLRAGDVVGAWAGVRPLATGGSAATGDLSRRHCLIDSGDGMLTITGGKLTTYRRMARDVVNRIVAADGRRARCRTAGIPLGLTGALEPFREQIVAAGRALGLPRSVGTLLVRTHGEAAAEVLSLVAQDPRLARVLSPAADHIAAEVVYAARAEGAATLEDVFSRRMRLSLRARDAALPVARYAAELLAAELGRDGDWVAGQVRGYAASVRAERGVVGLDAAA